MPLPIHIRRDGRPSALRHEGWWECIELHDRQYLATKAAWRRTIRRTHPDLNPPRVIRNLPIVTKGWQMREKLTAYHRWHTEERWYYWLRGLMPPDWKGVPKPPPGWKKQGRSRRAVSRMAA